MALLHVQKGRKVVGIHVRRGEHLALGHLNFPPDEYFEKAMRYFNAKLGHPRFVVITNDAVWCKSAPFFQHRDVTIFDSTDLEMDFATLVKCDGLILSLGTFGWWAGWLAHTLNRTPVIYHTHEFNMDHVINRNQIDVSTYYPGTWISME